MTENRDRNRFLVLQLMRISGAVLFVLGVMVMGGRLDWPPVLGYLLIVVGLFEALFLPTYLARHWRSPPE
ncbi:hypothetical protein GCM10011371_23290 [Novosphingobium marinum]|uniref:DUF2892 domain-containing protein n=1 Tax=Novosphingobium marinum TaxID=1514948 RepID=A0A7Y9XXK3_9SPHN|nr:hypothetical protein [Novosphingobium marinum]NYH96444.1 hypothetical protein [Novosphingobium marinum]GGC35277.1 hypothetical protein GCM10011371_23290 [Novosphingobium marinum]